MTHEEKIKFCASVRCERSEIYTQTDREVRGHSRADLDFKPQKAWKTYWLRKTYWLKQSPPQRPQRLFPSSHFNDFLMLSPHAFTTPPLPGVSWLGVWKNTGAGGGHLPGGHRHWKRLTLSTHCPLFTHGLLWHSFTSSSQCTPLKPAQMDHTCSSDRNKGAFQPRKHKCAEIAKTPASTSSSSKKSSSL